MLFSALFPVIVLPVIDPIAVALGPVAIRWYALSYVAGALLGWWYLGRLNRVRQTLPPRAYDDIVLWAVLGIMIGGRLGYVLFYKPTYYLANPLEILFVWHGGMSFHGGLLGVLGAIFLMSRRYGISFLAITDLLACVTPIGLGLGRIANFINRELYGRASDAPWAVLFPGHAYPRHPSQLYEAALEGLVLLLIMAWLFYRSRMREHDGMLSGAFLCGYALFRSLAECFREPDEDIGMLLGGVTMGQFLSLPMLAVGVYLIARARCLKPS